MALPAQIVPLESNVRFAGAQNAARPPIYTYNGDIFTLIYDDGNDTAEMWLDSAPSRGEGFAEADAAGHPSVNSGGNQSHRKPISCRVGDTVYVLHMDTSTNLTVTPFYLGTKKWGTSKFGGPIKPDVGADTNLAILPIPGEKLRIGFQGPSVSFKSTVYYVDLTLAGSWGSPVIVNDNAGTEHFYLSSMLPGKGGRQHYFYFHDKVGDTLYHRSIEPDGTKNTEQSVVTFSEAGNESAGWDCGGSYFDILSGEVKLAMPYNLYDTGSPGSRQMRFRVALADSAADPSWSTEQVTDDPIYIEGVAGDGTKSCCWLDGKLYYAMAGVALADLPASLNERDIYLAVRSSGVWGTPSLILNDASLAVFRPRIAPIDVGYAIVSEKVISGFGKSFYYEATVDPCPGGLQARRWPFIRRMYTGR